jgi:hypothetical protein
VPESRAEEYSRRARECRSQAAETTDYESKVGWLRLAAKWQSMAAEAHPPGQQAQQPQLKSDG